METSVPQNQWEDQNQMGRCGKEGCRAADEDKRMEEKN
jgi:hypothetical protein